MGDLAWEIEEQASKRSLVHAMDTRFVLLFTLVLIIYAVVQEDLRRLILLEGLLLFLFIVARLGPGYVSKRLLLVFPFGGFLALMQPFFRPGEVIWSLGPLSVTQEGVDIGLLLLAKLFVTISSVILLSSTSSSYKIFNSLRTFKVPGVMVAILNMMSRYIHLFDRNRKRMAEAWKARCFTRAGHPCGYRFVLRTLGRGIGALFVRSFEQGERTFDAMKARGYTRRSKYRVLGRAGDKVTGAVLLLLIVVFIIFLEVGDLSFLNIV